MADYGLEEDQQMNARALIAALRGQQVGGDPNRQAAIADQDRVGLLLQSSGDRVLSPMGSGLQQRAQQERSLEAMAPTKRLLAQAASQRAGAYQENVDSLSEKRGRPQYETKEADDGGMYAINRADPTDVSLVHQSDKKLGTPRLLKGGKGGGAPAGPPDPREDAMVERAARDYNLGAGLPQMGSGKDAAALKKRVLLRAAEIAGTGADGVAGVAADYKANRHSLEGLQGQQDKSEILENTALRNLDVAVAAAKKLGGPGSPLFNMPYQKVRSILGDKDMTAYNVARQAAVGEAGKLLNGSLGNGGLSEGARHEVEQLLQEGSSFAQIETAVGIIKQDIANRQAAGHHQIETVRGRVSGRKEAPEAPAHAATAKTAAFTHVRTDPATGETRGWDGKQWVPIKAGE